MLGAKTKRFMYCVADRVARRYFKNLKFSIDQVDAFFRSYWKFSANDILSMADDDARRLEECDATHVILDFLGTLSARPDHLSFKTGQRLLRNLRHYCSPWYVEDMIKTKDFGDDHLSLTGPGFSKEQTNALVETLRQGFVIVGEEYTPVENKQ